MEEKYTYKIFDDGYDIYNEFGLMLTQRDPYSKMYDPDGTYEENAKLHIKELLTPLPPAPPEPPTPDELLRGDVDYLAIMLDADLPSYDIEEEVE